MNYAHKHINTFSNRRLTLKAEDGKKTKEGRVPMNVTVTPEDKRFLKVYVAEHDTTVSALITEYIKKLREESKK